MSGTYDLFVLQRAPMPGTTGVVKVHATMRGHDAITSDVDVYIVDRGDDDAEPEQIIDVEQALAAVSASPRLGLVQYDIDDTFVNCTFLSEYNDGHMDGVKLSIEQRAFEEQPHLRDKMVALGRALHDELDAVRTVMAWGVAERGFDWRAELAKARGGERAGTFDLLDLFSPDPPSR
jgi:hypothetical protein